MLQLSYILDQTAYSGDSATVAAAIEALKPAAADWLLAIWEPGRASLREGQAITISFTALPGTTARSLTVTLDAELFTTIAAAYMLWGWSAPAEIDAQAAIDPILLPGAKDMIRETVLFLRHRIAAKLVALEERLSVFAKTEWLDKADLLTAWREHYFRPTSATRHKFADAKLAGVALSLLAKYFTQLRMLERSQKQRADAGYSVANYQPGRDDETSPDFYRTWGKRELEIRARMAEIVREMMDACPPMAMALLTVHGASGKVTTDHYKGVKLEQSYEAGDVATAIVKAIDAVTAQLAGQIRTLSLPGVAAGLKLPSPANNKGSVEGAERILAGQCMDDWTLADVFGAAFSGDGEEAMNAVGHYFSQVAANLILGRGEILASYLDSEDALEMDAFQQCVGLHHLHAIENEETRREIRSNRYSAITRAIRWISAVVSIVAMIAATAASEGAAAPALVTMICSLIATLDANLAVALIVLAALDFKIAQDMDKAEWKAIVSRLTAADPDTMMQVGGMMGRMSSYSVQLTGEVISLLMRKRLVQFNQTIVFRFGLPNELNLAKRAFELEGLAGDLGATFEDGRILFADVSEDEAEGG